MQWAVELNEFNVSYAPHTSVKSRVLADFIAEWTSVEEKRPNMVKDHWTLFFDGSLMLQGSGAGIVLKSPTGDELRYVV